MAKQPRRAESGQALSWRVDHSPFDTNQGQFTNLFPWLWFVAVLVNCLYNQLTSSSPATPVSHSFIHSLSVLSYDRLRASSKTIPPHSAI